MRSANCEKNEYGIAKKRINMVDIFDIGWAATEIHRQRSLMWRSTRLSQGKTNYFQWVWSVCSDNFNIGKAPRLVLASAAPSKGIFGSGWARGWEWLAGKTIKYKFYFLYVQICGISEIVHFTSIKTKIQN